MSLQSIALRSYSDLISAASTIRCGEPTESLVPYLKQWPDLPRDVSDELVYQLTPRYNEFISEGAHLWLWVAVQMRELPLHGVLGWIALSELASVRSDLARKATSLLAG